MASVARPSRYLPAALACAALANLAQAPFFWPGGQAVPSSFAVSHLAFLIVVNLCLAVALGSRAEYRAWAAALFWLPITLSLARGRALHSLSQEATQGLAVALGLSATVATLKLRRLGRGAPLVTAPLGAVAGAALTAFLMDFFRGRQTDTGSLFLGGTLALGFLGLFYLSHRLPALAGAPSSRNAWLIVLAAVPGAFAAHQVSLAARMLAPRGAVTGSGPPIVLIVLDTVRADHLRSYGYPRDTMPHLEQFARRHCVRVERALATGPSSLETHASMFTGLYPPRHGAHKPHADDVAWASYAYPLSHELVSAAELLGRHGYWNVAVSANPGPLAPDFGLDQGFHIYRALADPLKARTPWRTPFAEIPLLQRLGRSAWLADNGFLNATHYRRADEISTEAIVAWEAASTRPLFLFVNYLDAHEFYGRPRAFLDAFEGRRPDLPVDGLPQATVQALFEEKRDLTGPERDHLAALYDGQLRYLDAQLERLLGALEQSSRFDETLVIVTADHGLALGEHRLIGNTYHLYEEFVRVPLFVKPARSDRNAPEPGSVSPALVQSVDLFPLFLRHAGLAAVDGIDGVPWPQDRDAAFAWAYPPMNADVYPWRFRRDLRSIRRGDWKLIEWSTGRIELYDLASDPAELDDRCAREPQRVAALLAQLGPKPARAARRKQEDRQSSEVVERLRALGYVR